MGELAEIQAAPKPTLAAGNRPRAIVPTDIEQVWRMAEIVLKAGLAPHDLDSKEKITVALLHGLEIGLPPMLALNKIAIVNGRPSVWGDAVPGIALGTGLLEDWQERLDGDGDHMVATCTVKRKGVKSAKTQTFSVVDARRAGLWDDRAKVKRRGKNGEWYEKENDSPWHRYPKRMLAMRARVVFRDLFADAFGGLLIAEELIGTQEPLPPQDEPQNAAPASLMIEAPSAGDVRVGGAMAQTEPEEADVASNGRPLPPLVRKAAPAVVAAPETGSIDFASFRQALSATKTLEEANDIYEQFTARETPLSPDQLDEADLIMREACAKGWD